MRLIKRIPLKPVLEQFGLTIIRSVFQEQSRASATVFVLLCLAMISFPFSVAVTNVCLGICLAGGVVSGLWWAGVQQLWHQERLLFVALVAYLLLIPLGLLWSLDLSWGQRILARHWFWLLLPLVVLLLSFEKNRNIFLSAVSFGLVANLSFCALQSMGWIDSPIVAGSSPDNATGHIGHTSFGIIYGIWSAWLLHFGLMHGGKLKWLAWALALWSVVMVFMAQGQSGYIVTVCLLLLVIGKWVNELHIKNVMIGFAVLLMLGVVIVMGAGHERITGTWKALTQSEQVADNPTQSLAKSSAQARLAWWSMSVEIWKQSSVFGVGTGGFPAAVKAWQNNPDKQFGFINNFSHVQGVVHPHNQYLITLVRYGLIGLFIMLFLMVVWIRRGLNRRWQDELASPLIALTAIALLLHGMTSISLEEHFSSVFAVVLLAAGLSEERIARHNSV